jgi:hypothetical protein
MDHKQYVDELNDITLVLSKIPQKLGFSHKFYVPGWIGFIQECIVESKMNRIAKLPIYNGLGYFECADKIIELVSKACESRKNSVENFQKENDNPDNLEILAAASNAMEAWCHIYPEIAYWMNRKIDDKYVTCAYGILQRSVSDSISGIMSLPKDFSSSKSKSSFTGEMKAMGNQLLAMICNVIAFAIIIAIISAIADLF